MAKKGGGSKKSFWNNPFGGMFDFNRDGKEDLGELWVAQKIFDECTKEKEQQHDDSSDYMYHSALDDDFIDTSWREFCEDGSEFDIDPEDYETEDEYNEALEEARNAWRDTCEDSSEYGLDPDDFETEDEYNEAFEEAQANVLDSVSAPTITLQFSVECPDINKIKEENYPNKRRYNAACTLANKFICYSDSEYEKREKACCKFIVDKADTIPAANYLSHKDGFLYSQAIKDNFSLSISLPDEDETREFELYQILIKIAKGDIPLSFKVWSWCLEQFMPYAEYDNYALFDMTTSIIDKLYNFPDGYKLYLVRYMNTAPNFTRFILNANCEAPNAMPELIVTAIKDNLPTIALQLFKSTLTKAGEDWKKINQFAENMITRSKDYKEVETIEFFRDNMFPMIKAIPIGMVQDEISGWDAKIVEYIKITVAGSDKYTYSRENAWRLSVPDGKEYGTITRNKNILKTYTKKNIVGVNGMRIVTLLGLM